MNSPEAVDSLLEGQPDLLTTDEVAELMRVSQGTVLRWIKEQGLTVISVGPRLRRVQRSHFREWLLQADEIND
ncbi:helix-turn-helix domain-containing protein [Citricoccus sp. GCM10030269]|uniref:helix-turn-helix domain-containing protein n=1 Tax=Citricoccus sp. GCM10030269 TaxID=3273388 RepID=UPI00360DCE95